MAFVVGAISFLGALVQGQQQAAEMRQQANVQEYQAKIAERNAQIAGQQASAEQERVRREQRQVLGQQRAALAESGTGFSGSNEDIIRQSTTMAELDALNIQYEGEIERRGLLEQAEISRYNAMNLRANARSVMRSRWLTALGAGASAYGGAGGKFFFGKQEGKG